MEVALVWEAKKYFSHLNISPPKYMGEEVNRNIWRGNWGSISEMGIIWELSYFNQKKKLICNMFINTFYDWAKLEAFIFKSFSWSFNNMVNMYFNAFNKCIK